MKYIVEGYGKKQGQGLTVHRRPWPRSYLRFFHFSLGQHIRHDLCAKVKGVYEGLAIGQNILLRLALHVIRGSHRGVRYFSLNAGAAKTCIHGDIALVVPRFLTQKKDQSQVVERRLG